MKSKGTRSAAVAAGLVAAALVVWWSLAGREGSELSRARSEERERQDQMRRDFPVEQRRDEERRGRMGTAS